MPAFRKKPVVIQAFRWTGTNMQEAIDWLASLNDESDPAKVEFDFRGGFGVITPLIRTLEGQMTVSVGDWIIRGTKGEFYPCKPDVFEDVYEAVI